MLVMAKKVTKLDLPAPKVTVSKYVVDDIQTGHWALLFATGFGEVEEGGLQRLTLTPPLRCIKLIDSFLTSEY